MKLAMAMAVYGLMALVLAAGILMVMAGKPWLLIFSLVAYIVLFSKVGCLSH